MSHIARAFRWLVAIRWRYCLITAAGYAGITGTIDVAKHRFWWPGALLAAVGWYLLVYSMMWAIDVIERRLDKRNARIVRERQLRREHS